MSLWKENEEDLKVNIAAGERIETSGVYEVKVKEAYLSYSNTTDAKGLSLVLESNEGVARATLWFIKGDGEVNTFISRRLNRMLYLMKVKLNKLEIKEQKVKLYDGKEIEREYITNLKDKEIGIFLEVKKVDDGRFNYDIKDFFDIKSKRTTDEITNNEDPKMYYFYENKYKEVEKITETKSKEEDAFPF